MAYDRFSIIPKQRFCTSKLLIPNSIRERTLISFIMISTDFKEFLIKFRIDSRNDYWPLSIAFFAFRRNQMQKISDWKIRWILAMIAS